MAEVSAKDVEIIRRITFQGSFVFVGASVQKEDRARRGCDKDHDHDNDYGKSREIRKGVSRTCFQGP